MRRSVLAVLAMSLAGLSACGNDGPAQPPLSSFTEGTCRAAAPDVLALGKAGARLGKRETVDEAVKGELKVAQEGLRTITDGAEPTYKPAFEMLVESTGFVRIRADGNSYEPALGRQLMSDYDAVVKLCTAR